jgi:acyl-[acyl-carrier-protein] desaturase
MAIETNYENILRDMQPDVEVELNRHYNQANLWYPKAYLPSIDEKSGQVVDHEGEPWDPAWSKMSEVAQNSWHLNLLTEDNLPSYHYEIATIFGRDEAWGEWVHRWTAEEHRHGYAMRAFADITNALDHIALEDDRMEFMSKGYSSGDKDALHAVAYVTMQELATRIAHRNTAKACQESGAIKAADLLEVIANDENLHMVFYRNLGAAALKVAPNEFIQAVADEIINFKMPGKGMPDFKERAAEIALAGIYDPDLYLNQVVDPTLKKWKILKLDDLSPEGQKAQEDLGNYIEDVIKPGVTNFKRLREAVLAYREAEQEKVGSQA